MKVLVTGASGLIGSRFSGIFGSQLELIAANRAAGIDITDGEGALSILENECGIRELDAVVHLAAYTNVSEAYRQNGDRGGECYRLNVEGTENVAQIANHFGAHLVHFSTDFVFAGEHDGSLDEQSEVRPIEWYGKTKLIAEQRVAELASSWTIMRVSFPFMEKPGVRSDLVNTIKGKLQNGETLMLFGDQFITPSFGDDLVRAAHSFCIEKPQSELFHVCGPDWFTPFQLGHAIAEELEIENPDIIQTSLDSFLETDPRPRQKCLRMDTRKYQQYCPSKGIPEPMGLREVLRNSLKQGDVSA